MTAEENLRWPVTATLYSEIIGLPVTAEGNIRLPMSDEENLRLPVTAEENLRLPETAEVNYMAASDS